MALSVVLQIRFSGILWDGLCSRLVVRRGNSCLYISPEIQFLLLYCVSFAKLYPIIEEEVSDNVAFNTSETSAYVAFFHLTFFLRCIETIRRILLLI